MYERFEREGVKKKRKRREEKKKEKKRYMLKPLLAEFSKF